MINIECFDSNKGKIIFGSISESSQSVRKNILYTDFLDINRKIILAEYGIEFLIEGVDHYWGMAGMVVNGRANRKSIGIGVHPNFSLPRDIITSENYYDSIESVSLVFMTHGNVKRMRSSIKSQGLNKPFTKNCNRINLSDFNYDIKFTSDFYF